MQCIQNFRLNLNKKTQLKIPWFHLISWCGKNLRETASEIRNLDATIKDYRHSKVFAFINSAYFFMLCAEISQLTAHSFSQHRKQPKQSFILLALLICFFFFFFWNVREIPNKNHILFLFKYKLPETMRKLCPSTKFPHQEIRWNYGIFRRRD